LVQVPDTKTLERVITELWTDSQTALAYGERAKQVVNTKAGAIRASAECLLELLAHRA